MKPGLKLAVAQMNSRPGRVQENLKRARSLVEAAAGQGAELVLLPETFTTGVDVEDQLSDVAQPVPGPSTELLEEVAAENDIYVYGSMIEEDGSSFHNTGVFVSPGEGLLESYRKVHLFGDLERTYFEPGREPCVVETELGTFALTVCMDLCFPEYIRGLVLNGAEYILNTTDWLRYGDIGEWQWSHNQTKALARIRALENTVGLAMADQWGSEGPFTKFGHSCIVSPSGRILAGIEEGEGVVVHETGMEKLEEWRRIATYLEDRKDKLEIYRGMGLLEESGAGAPTT